MRQDTITYDFFCQIVLKMQKDGEKISVRTVLSHTGGSFAKIADFLKRWRQDQAHSRLLVDRELSPNLRQALLAEVGKAVAETKAIFETQVAQSSDQLDEVNEALAKQEKMLEDYEQRVNQLNQQLAVENELKASYVEKINRLEKKLEQLIQAQHEFDKRAAVAETRCTELEKQLVKKEKNSLEALNTKTPSAVSHTDA